jgi:hypothetical protein
MAGWRLVAWDRDLDWPDGIGGAIPLARATLAAPPTGCSCAAAQLDQRRDMLRGRGVGREGVFLSCWHGSGSGRARVASSLH